MAVLVEEVVVDEGVDEVVGTVAVLVDGVDGEEDEVSLSAVYMFVFFT